MVCGVSCFCFIGKIVFTLEINTRLYPMDRESYIAQVKNVLSSLKLRIRRGRCSDKETTDILPPCGRNWELPLNSVVLCHEDEHIKEGLIEIWVYLFAAFYNHGKISGRDMVGFLAFSAAAQTGLVKLSGYEYDKQYEGGDGTVVLFKKVFIRDLQEELKKVLKQVL
mgnify:CR=1 FL=1